MTIVLIILAIIALPFIIALFVPKTYNVKRKIRIDLPQAQVFNYIKYLKHQEEYSVWVMRDPNVRRTYTGNDGTPGFIAAWDSDDKNTGKGEQEITSVNEPISLSTVVRFEKPFKSTASGIMSVHNANDSSEVTWEIHGSNKYPLNLMNLFIDGMLGKDMDTSLRTLKTRLDGQKYL